jgi:hypothetical protein
VPFDNYNVTFKAHLILLEIMNRMTYVRQFLTRFELLRKTGSQSRNYLNREIPIKSRNCPHRCFKYAH